MSTGGIESLAAIKVNFHYNDQEYFRTRGLPHVGGRVPLEDKTFEAAPTGWDPTARKYVVTGSLKQTATDRIEVTFSGNHPYLESHSTFHKASATECEEERERRERILICELDDLEREERDDIDLNHSDVL